MTTLPIPEAALENHIAILGKTGSGKSNLAKVIVTGLLKKKRRVAIVDPTGTWWGLRLNADGTPSPWPIVIFGGEHGDIAIAEGHGAAIAETIGTTSTPAIVDTRLMTVGARTRFFTDFGEALLRTNQGPLTLIVDEAHLFAPQARVNDPRSGAMLHAANNLVSLGRGIGLSIVLISQRPAKLHKDSLTQVETLVAMRLIAPHDVRAIDDWIGEWADPALGKEITASLPSLPTGDAWVWAPELSHLKRVHVPLVETFDSGKAGPGRAAPALASIDVAKVTKKLEVVGRQVLENDPKVLKGELAKASAAIGKLQKELAQAAETEADPAALEAAEKRGFERGATTLSRDQAKRIATLQKELAAAMKFIIEINASGFFNAGGESIDRGAIEKAITEATKEATRAFEKQIERRNKELERLRRDSERFVERLKGLLESEVSVQVEVRHNEPFTITAPRPAQLRAAAVDLKVNTDGITPAKRKILVALRQLEAIGKAAPDKIQVALLAGASPTSSAYANNLGGLRSAGLIDYPSGGCASLTPTGRSIEPEVPPMSQADLMAFVQQLLPPAQFRIVEWLVGEYPNEVEKAALAESVGASPTSSAFANNLGRLRSIGLIDYPRQGFARAAEVLFP